LKAYAAAHPHTPCYSSRGLQHRAAVDADACAAGRAVADRPVVIQHTSEHAVWLNSAALQMAGVTDRPVADSDEERGVIRDASGHPSGVPARGRHAARRARGRRPRAARDKLAMFKQRPGT